VKFRGEAGLIEGPELPNMRTECVCLHGHVGDGLSEVVDKQQLLGEVERIWLPYAIWLRVGAAWLPARQRRA